MKKIHILCLSLFFMFYASIASASAIIDTAFSANFASTPESSSIEDVIAATPASTIPGIYFDYNDAKNPSYYTDNTTVAAIDGIILNFQNNSGSVVVLNWSNSVVSANGSSYGIPFLGGMKYKDAGNPSATPNTIIPPGQSIEVSAFVPRVEFKNKSFMVKGVPLLKDSDIAFSFYVAVIANGQTQYLEINTPGINIPKK